MRCIAFEKWIKFANSEIGAKWLHCRYAHPLFVCKIFPSGERANALWTLKFKFRRRKRTVAGVAFQWPRSQLSKLCTHTFEPNVTITMLIGSVLRSNWVAPTWEKLLRQVAMSNWYLCRTGMHMQFVQRHKLLLGRRTDCNVKQKQKLASHRISFECIFSNKFVFCHIFFRRLFPNWLPFTCIFFVTCAHTTYAHLCSIAVCTTVFALYILSCVTSCSYYFFFLRRHHLSPLACVLDCRVRNRQTH